MAKKKYTFSLDEKNIEEAKKFVETLKPTYSSFNHFVEQAIANELKYAKKHK